MVMNVVFKSLKVFADPENETSHKMKRIVLHGKTLPNMLALELLRLVTW
jgi:hypothetical protein